MAPLRMPYRPVQANDLDIIHPNPTVYSEWVRSSHCRAFHTEESDRVEWKQDQIRGGLRTSSYCLMPLSRPDRHAAIMT